MLLFYARLFPKQGDENGGLHCKVKGCLKTLAIVMRLRVRVCILKMLILGGAYAYFPNTSYFKQLNMRFNNFVTLIRCQKRENPMENAKK